MSKATGNGSENAERAAAGNGAGAIVRIQSMFDGFTPAERRVAEAILADPEALVLASISEVARRSKGSEAAVSRFARKIGYKSFAEFKLALSRDAASPRESVYGEVELGDDAETVLAKIAADNIRAIEDASHGVDQDALAEAARRISAANRVAFFGFDGSGAIARDARDHFVRVLGNVFHAADSHDQAVWTALCGPGDVLLLCSHAGTARDLVELAGRAAERGAFVIAITNHGGSRLAELAHLSLFTATREGRFREEALSSRIAALTLIDAIYALVALQRPEELGERNEAIGAALEERRVSEKRSAAAARR